MIATAGTTKSLKATVEYICNAEKGGEVIFSSGIPLFLNPTEKAHYLDRMSNPTFKVKAHTIVISHSDNDTKHLTPEEEKIVLQRFLGEMEKRGIDLNSAPWMVCRHGNTDNTHYHMLISNTCYDGSRFNDKFIGKTACRCAAAISDQLGLEAALKALRSERARKKRNKREKKELFPEITTEVLNKGHKRYINRVERIALARKRKEDEEKAKELKAKQKQEKPKDREGVGKLHSRGEEEITRPRFRR